MPVAITLDNVPDDLYARLQAAAAAHRRSLNREAISCLELALRPPESPATEVLSRARALRAQLKPGSFKASEIKQAIGKGRR
jgi:plasmid stability protein